MDYGSFGAGRAVGARGADGEVRRLRATLERERAEHQREIAEKNIEIEDLDTERNELTVHAAVLHAEKDIAAGLVTEFDSDLYLNKVQNATRGRIEQEKAARQAIRDEEAAEAAADLAARWRKIHRVRNWMIGIPFWFVVLVGGFGWVVDYFHIKSILGIAIHM